MDNRYITKYADVKNGKKKTLKSWMRDKALTALWLTASEKLLKTPRVQFLYIHHLFEDEEQNLDILLKKLSQNHEFISYSDAVNKVQTGNIDKPYITFSSDDGFRNNMKAAEILNRYNASACFFVNPGMVGETDFDKINRHCTDTLSFPPVEFLNWSEVNKLQQWGHEIGSHTMMHMNIAMASASQITEDLQQTLSILAERCGGVKHFAFPFGRFSHFSSVGRKAVFDAGFATCATAERGCHIAHPTPIPHTELCIRRDHTVLGWDIGHMMYFMINNVKKANINNNLFPQSLL
jgi:peptidoglycan/xylan/chitin deacetylase (PgdA/CDA1 family)